MKSPEFPFEVFSLLVLCLFSTSPAATVHFTVGLDGVQANAGRGTGSLSSGAGTVTLDTTTNRLEWEILFDAAALTDGAASVTVAHFHGGPVSTV